MMPVSTLPLASSLHIKAIRYIGRAISNAFNITATKLGKNQTASLDESIGEDGGQTRGDAIQSKELSPEDAAIMKNAKARLAEWMKNLSETDRKILALTKAGKTLREIGEAVGKSHEFVRQRIAELKAEARKAMEVSGEFQGMVGEQKKGPTNAGSSVGLSQSFPDYRGLAGDEQSLAGAASQFVEHLINIQPKGSFVKPPLEKINKKLQEIAEGKHIPAKSFITAMRDVGFLRSGTGGERIPESKQRFHHAALQSSRDGGNLCHSG